MTPYYDEGGITIYHGDALTVLKTLPDESVQCCVTSPPYWGLRDYKIPPSIWGGRRTCVHDWAEESLTVRTGTGGNWQQAENGPGLASGKPQTRFKGDTKAANQGEMREIQRGFCQRCGAWRGSLGLEPTPELYVQHLVEIFHAVRRVLRKDGTLWLNLGDSYHQGNKGQSGELKPTDKQASNGWSLATRRGAS